MLLTLGCQPQLTTKGTVQMMGHPVLLMFFPFSGKQLFENKAISSRIQILVITFVIWHITPEESLHRAADNENEAFYHVWLIKCVQHVFSAGQSFPCTSDRNLIAAVNESLYSKPNVSVAFNKM